MEHDIEAALETERRICRFMDEHIVPFRQKFGFSNAALDKLLSAIGNWGPVGTRLRWPYRWIDEHEAVRLRTIARRDYSGNVQASILSCRIGAQWQLTAAAKACKYCSLASYRRSTF